MYLNYTMNVLNLSLDVWSYIINIGELGISDVLHLMQTNRQLNSLLKHNVIWYKLVHDRYLKVLIDYDVESVKPLIDDKDNIEFYSLTIDYYKKELYFKRFLESESDIRRYLDLFVQDHDYLPILYNYQQQFNESILQGKLYIDLKRPAFVLNLLIAQEYKLAFQYFNTLLNNENSDCSPSLYERFWFKVSLFDKGSHKYIHFRSQKLKEIFNKLHQEIVIKKFYNRTKNGNIILHQHPNNEKDTLVFENEDHFNQLTVEIFRLTLSCFKFDNPMVSKYDHLVFNNYCKSYFLEDFSILRVYGNNIKGHPFLIMSILMKVMHEFLLSKYNIKFQGHENFEDITINMTPTYLRLRNHVFSFDRKILHLHTQFEVYTIDEVIRNLRDRSYFEVSKFIEPLDFKYITECYLHLDYFLGAKSLSTIIRPDNYFESNLPVSLTVLLDKDLSLVTYEDYLFLKLICKFVQDKDSNNELLDTMFCSEFEKTLNSMNNFIHFNAIYQVFNDNKTKQNRLRQHFFTDSDNSFTSNFNLSDPSSKISLSKILQSYHCSEPTIQNKFQGGSIIKHKKFICYGIVLGKVIASNNNIVYYRVYTTKRSVECYREDSMILIDNSTPNMSDIISFVINSCGIDILGLLFYKGLQINGDFPRFVTI